MYGGRRGAVSRTRLAGEVKLGYLQIAGLRDFQVAGAAGDDMDGDPGAFEQAGLVGAAKLIGFSRGKGLAHEPNEGALRGLGVDDEFAGDGSDDKGAVGGAFHFFDGVGGGHADDGGAVALDGVYRPIDGGGIDEGPHGVVDEHDVRFTRRRQRAQGVRYGVLAHVAAGDDVYAVGEAVLGQQFAESLLFGLADGDVDGGDTRNREKGAQAMDKKRNAAEGEELLGSDAGGWGHASAEPGRGEDDKDSHGNPSIPFGRIRGTAAGGGLDARLQGIDEKTG